MSEEIGRIIDAEIPDYTEFVLNQRDSIRASMKKRSRSLQLDDIEVALLTVASQLCELNMNLADLLASANRIEDKTSEISDRLHSR